MNALALHALRKDPDPALFEYIWNLLQRTSLEIRDESGRGYVATRAYQSLYRNGARESVTRAVMKQRTEGFGRVEQAGRFDLTYEWLVLDPTWQFSEEVRQRAWQRLNQSFADCASL